MSTDNVIEFERPESALAEEARIAAELVSAIRGGDQQAETRLVERYSRGLRYLLLRRVHNEERARDLLQETLCIAIEKLRSVDIENPARLAGYLRGIAVRVSLNAGRRRQREPLPIDNEAIAALPDSEPRQFQTISAEENAAAVRRLLDTLRVPRDREILLRYYLYDQDKDEICRALQLNSLHFNRVLFRAKGRFRKIMEDTANVTRR